MSFSFPFVLSIPNMKMASCCDGGGGGALEVDYSVCGLVLGIASVNDSL